MLQKYSGSTVVFFTRPKESNQVSVRLRNLRCEAAKVLTGTAEPMKMNMTMMMMMTTTVSLSKFIMENKANN
jgi:hypothetical protein